MEAWVPAGSFDRAREDRFVEFVLALHDGVACALEPHITTLRERLEHLKRQIRQYNPNSYNGRRKIGRKRTELIRLRGQLAESVRQRDLAVRDKEDTLRKQYRNIRSIPRVLDAHVTGESLIITTDVLYGQDRSERWHRIGPYTITINIVHGSVPNIRWKNGDGERKNLQGPPNIGASGAAVSGCMGLVAGRLVTEAFASRDYATLVAVVVRYPECRGATETILHWPVVSPEEVPEWYLRATFDKFES